MCHFLFQHGEPGAAVADIQPVDVIVSHVLNQILSTVSLTQWLLLCILTFCLTASSLMFYLLNKFEGKIIDPDKNIEIQLLTPYSFHFSSFYPSTLIKPLFGPDSY